MLIKLNVNVGINIGTQTMDPLETLCFPRGTQTPRQSYADISVETDPVLTNDLATVMLMEACDKFTQMYETKKGEVDTQTQSTETREVSTETVSNICDASTETERTEEFDVGTETESRKPSIDAHIAVEKQKSFCDRECSPFAMVFAAVAPRATPSLLFPTAMSQALMSGASAGIFQ